MARHIVLKVYAVEINDSVGRDMDTVTIEFDGELKPKTKRAVQAAFEQQDYTFRFRKKVLA